jgi:hypothetical protein
MAMNFIKLPEFAPTPVASLSGPPWKAISNRLIIEPLYVARQIACMPFRKVSTKEPIRVDASVCNCLVTSAQRL